MKALVFGILIFLSNAAGAADSKSSDFPLGPILKDTQIYVESYEESSRTFQVKIVGQPGVGPLVVTPENLAAAMGVDGPKKIFAKRPGKIAHSEVHIVKDLPLLKNEEIEQRRTKFAKKKK